MQEVARPTLDLSSIKRQAIKPTSELVTIKPLLHEGVPPVLIESHLESLELGAWCENNLSVIRELLQKHGGILFRGFNTEGPETLTNFTHAIQLQLMNYMEGATPRKAVGNNVYTSTEFPPEHTIALHNENSYVMTWPMKICFFCVIAPHDRGETPIADVRKVLDHISTATRARFEDKMYMLVFNFRKHLSLPWQNSFKVSSKEELEAYCVQARIEPEWVSDDHLRTRQVRPAITRHPVTGETVWFNHMAFWHVSSLEKDLRELLVSGYSEEGIPYNTYYGDGSRIDDDVVEEVRKAYDAETVKFPWQKGDLLLLDNMLVAHARSPFSGPRKIVVSMGEPYTRTDM